MTSGPIRRLLRGVRGFLTIPGAISLSGAGLAVLAHMADASIHWAGAAGLPAFLIISLETGRSVLSATATAALSALVMIYSMVLLTYTMAASSIGPRLLQRFREDRTNQLSIGLMGATFLYCLIGLWLVREDTSIHLTAAGAVFLATSSILLLLYFVKTVSQRVTIDQEAAEIALALNREIDRALDGGAAVASDRVVLPEADEFAVLSESSGYVDTINGPEIARMASECAVVVVYRVRPGDFIMQGQVLAVILGSGAAALEAPVRAAAPLLTARDPVGDVRFSLNLLVEIALRALSPGVNDTFTAIGCVDHLSASLARARTRGLSVGVFTDASGAVRAVFPSIDADVLFGEAIPPLRRAARGNALMTDALIRALERMAVAAPKDQHDIHLKELQQIAEDLQECALSVQDQDQIRQRVEAAAERVLSGDGASGV